MIHQMKLRSDPFARIKSGKKFDFILVEDEMKEREYGVVGIEIKLINGDE